MEFRNINWTSQHFAFLKSSISKTFTSGEFTDVTLCCEHQKIQAHRLMLSLFSTQLRDIMKDVTGENPVIILYGIKFTVLSNILHYIYNGEVNIDLEHLEEFTSTSKMLGIVGLADTNPVATNSQLDEPVTKTEMDPRTQEPSQVSIKKEYGFRCKRNVENRSNNNQFFQETLNPEFAETITVNKAGLKNELKSEQIEDTKNSSSEPPKPTLNDTRTGCFSESSVKCNICKKVFAHPYSLNHHRAVHSGSTQCPICNIVLSRKFNLKMHLKARHNL